jgi:hypothetical protein
MTLHPSAKNISSHTGVFEELSFDQLEQFSGGINPFLIVKVFHAGFTVGQGISTIPPVRNALVSVGDEIGTWLGNNGIWW